MLDDLPVIGGAIDVYKRASASMTKWRTSFRLSGCKSEDTRFKAFEELWARRINNNKVHNDYLDEIVYNLLHPYAGNDLRFVSKRAFEYVVENNIELLQRFVPRFIKLLIGLHEVPGYYNKTSYAEHASYALKTIIQKDVRPVEKYLPMLIARAHDNVADILLAMAWKDPRALVAHRQQIEEAYKRDGSISQDLKETLKLIGQCAGAMSKPAPSLPKDAGKSPAAPKEAVPA